MEEGFEETYAEVLTEEDYYEDDFTLGDYVFLGFFAILICGVFAFVVKTISKHIKNVNLKVGKVEVGVESKDTSVEKKKES